MGVDNKYGKVTVEKGTIGEDEPVVVFRAKDKLLLDVLRYYRNRCDEAGSPPGHLDAIWDDMQRVSEWQQANATQVPQSEGYEGSD